MAQLITLSILGICIGVAVLLSVVVLVFVLLGSPPTPKSGSSRRSYNILLRRTGHSISSVFGASIAAMLVSASLIVARPAVLDPLCDYFDWFGAKTATTARQYAAVAHAPITL